jgi:hypothetical protein
MEGLGSTLRLSVPATPLVCAEALDRGVVAGLPCARVVSAFRFHGFGQAIRENGAYGVQRVVTRQTFSGEAIHGPSDRLEPFGDLILDDGMKHGVRLQVRQFDASDSMMRFGKLYSLCFVERQPLGCVWCDFGIVELHGVRSWGLTFDMSGGPKGAKRPLERPLDGGVRRRPHGLDSCAC